MPTCHTQVATRNDKNKLEGRWLTLYRDTGTPLTHDVEREMCAKGIRSLFCPGKWSRLHKNLLSATIQLHWPG